MDHFIVSSSGETDGKHRLRELPIFSKIEDELILFADRIWPIASRKHINSGTPTSGVSSSRTIKEPLIKTALIGNQVQVLIIGCLHLVSGTLFCPRTGVNNILLERDKVVRGSVVKRRAGRQGSRIPVRVPPHPKQTETNRFWLIDGFFLALDDQY
jgi:hypothetical protein